MKTARFTDIVSACGQPQIHLAWVAPATDPALLVAVKKHLVLTVHQRARGAKKDFGVVGLDVAKDAQFLIFKKSLARFAGKQVVGIRYDLLNETLSVGVTPKGRAPNLQSKMLKKERTSQGTVLPFVIPVAARGSEDESNPPSTPRTTISSKAPRTLKRQSKVTPPTAAEMMKRDIRIALEEFESGAEVRAKQRLRELLKL